MERRERDPDTGEYQIMYGEGVFDTLKNMRSKIASKRTGKTAKKLATNASEKLIEKGAEKIGDKTGQLIGEKIYNKFSDKPQTTQTDETKGDEIVKLLQQENKKQPQAAQNVDKYKYVKDVYNDLLL